MSKYIFSALQLVVGSVLLLSCSDRTLNIDSVNIPLQSTDTAMTTFNDYFDISMCLPLEDTNECHISFARRIECFEENYYVFSSNGNVGLFVFGRDGKFIRKIGEKGHGPGEYTNILDFTIDRKNRRLLLLCNMPSLVKVYTLDGTFLEEKVLGNVSLSDIACVNGLILCPTNHQGFTRNESDSLFYIFDKDFKLVKKHTFISDNSIGTTSFIPANIKAYGDKFVFSDFHEHRTFLLDNHGDVEKCFQYEDDKLISLDNQKSIKSFMDNQLKSSFILSSSILNDKCITFYKSGKSINLSINKPDGARIVNSAIRSFPDFLGYDGSLAISAVTQGELKDLNVKSEYDNADSHGFYIIKYKLKEKYANQ